MVAARGVSNGLDTLMRAQKRLVLQSESFQAHLGRRCKTSITLRISLAIFKMTLVSSSETHYTAPSYSESIILIAVVHAELHWPMKYTKKTKNYQHRIILALGHTHSA